MIMEGCQGKPQISIMDKICPQCGHEIEIFSIDTEAVCENCGFTIYNDTLTCVQWCKYAKQCDLCSMVQIRKAVLWRHGI